MLNVEYHHVQERIIIKDDTLELKQLVVADASSYFHLIAFDPDHLQQFGDTTAKKYLDSDSVRESIAHPENPNKLRFGIWDKEKMVGSINLTPQGENMAEIGYWIGKEHLGHSYAARALTQLAGYASTILGYQELFCNVVVGNEASKKVVEKAGFNLDSEFIGTKGQKMEKYVLRYEREEL